LAEKKISLPELYTNPNEMNLLVFGSNLNGCQWLPKSVKPVYWQRSYFRETSQTRNAGSMHEFRGFSSLLQFSFLDAFALLQQKAWAEPYEKEPLEIQ
jgi:hypothetical protein